MFGKSASNQDIKKEEKKVEQLREEKKILQDEVQEKKESFLGVESDEKRVERQLDREESRLDSMKGGFSLKGIFESKGSGRSEESPIDLSRIWRWIVKNKMLFLILIPLLLSIYVRTGTKDMPIVTDWAANSVNSFIRSDIETVINAQYPNLPADSKTKLIDQQFAKATKDATYTIQTGQYRGQTMNIANEVQNNAAQLKQFWQYDLNGKQVTYMPDIDPYFYLRYAQNLLTKRMLGDVATPSGGSLDNHMKAPIGEGVDYETVGVIPYVIAWNHKLMSLFEGGIDIMQTAAMVPVIIMALATIPAFLLGRRLAGNMGGFMVATMVAINGAALSRTLWGHPDTDGFQLLFPMTVMWLTVESIIAKKMLRKIIFATIAGATTAVYSIAWVGWWHLFDFTLAALGAYGLWTIVRKHEDGLKAIDPRNNIEWRDALLFGLVFLVVCGTFMIGLSTFDRFTNAASLPFGFSSDFKVAARPSLWPNVYTTVAELNPASFASAIHSVGGNILLAIAILGIVLLLLQREQQTASVFTAIIITLWLIGTIYASSKGIRFTLLIVPAVSAGFGIGIGLLHKHLVRFSREGLRLPNFVTTTAFLIAVFVLLLWAPISSAREQGAQDVPIMNDAWWTALTKIKDNSKTDAVINSWWDFGHHFKYVADRAVTADGASQNSPPAHWIGLVLMTDDEEFATNVLRMLDCGNKRSIEMLDEFTPNTAISVKLMKEAIMMPKNQARTLFIENGVPKDKVDELIKLTHCVPPENFFITSDDMVGKSGVWGHFGSWDFMRAYLHINHHSSTRDVAVADLVKTFNMSEKNAENLYFDDQGLTDENSANQWIAPWPSYVSGLAGCSVRGPIMQCGNGLQLNSTNGEATVQVQGGTVRPKSIVYINETGDFVERNYNDSGVDISAAIIPANGGFQSILMSPQLASSMFTRLFFFRGHGLSHFKLFDEQRQLTGGNILTWKIDWEGKEPNEVFTSAESEPEIQKPKEGDLTNSTVVTNNTSTQNKSAITNKTTTGIATNKTLDNVTTENATANTTDASAA